jgi:hypothetical protein
VGAPGSACSNASLFAAAALRAVACFLHASAMIEGNTAEDGKGIDRLFMHVALPVRQKKSIA